MKHLFLIALLILISQVSLARAPVTMIAGPGPAGSGPGSGGGGQTFTFIGSASGINDATDTPVSTTSGTISVVAGDLIMAAAQWEDTPSAEIATFRDNNTNNALTKDSEIANAGGEMSLHTWTGIANTTNATASFTATLDSSSPYKKIVVMVYRKSGGTISKDITGTVTTKDDTNTDNSVSVGPFSTLGVSNVVCAFAGFYTGGTWSGQAFNLDAADNSQTPGGMLGWCRDNSLALTNANGTANFTSNMYWVSSVISYRAD